MKLCREFFFDSAHFLPKYKGTCERFHGHTYKVEVTLAGEIEKDTGMVMDFNELKNIFNKNVMEALDHRNLNDILQMPTCENIAKWIFDKLKKEIPNLYSVKVWEGYNKWVLIEK